MYNYEGVIILYIQISLLFRLLMNIHQKRNFSCVRQPSSRYLEVCPGVGPYNGNKIIFIRCVNPKMLQEEQKNLKKVSSLGSTVDLLQIIEIHVIVLMILSYEYNF